MRLPLTAVFANLPELTQRGYNDIALDYALALPVLGDRGLGQTRRVAAAREEANLR